jgi:arylsulfatase A-like enzyme
MKYNVLLRAHPMTTLKKWLPLWLLLPILLAGCQKAKRSDFRLYRFIDELRLENILDSPFLKEGAPGQTGRFAPLKSAPLTDLGSGENPFSLKKKLRLGGTEINILFAPPPSIYRYKSTLASGGTLEFGIGIVRDENSEALPVRNAPGEAGGHFKVSLERNGRRKVLSEHFVALPPPGEYQTSHHSVELPALAKDTRLVLETEGGEGLFAFWQNPVLYTRAAKTRPVILISVDTLRADHVGCYGYARETTPAIDALAADSALFLNTYASSPWTLPSHVSLLTSLHGVHHRVYHEDEKMASDLITLADVMRSAGFMTSAITDGGLVSAVYGFSKGFDSYLERGGGVFSFDSAGQINRLASEWLDGNKEKDFFLFIHTYQPHDPHACPAPYNTMFLEENPLWLSLNLMGTLGGYAGIYSELTERERQNVIGLYDGEIRYADEALVGALLAKLKEMGLYDSALIILTSDHGEEFFDHHSWAHGHQLYDESLKVPLIIKFPGSRFMGRRYEPHVRLVDIMPTIIEEVGASAADRTIDGKSLFPVLRGKENEDRNFLADIGDNIFSSHVGRKIALSSGKNKMILNKPFSPEDLKFFTSPPRLVPAIELFDVAQDPRERQNLADEKLAVARKLNSRIVDIFKRAGQRKSVKAQVDDNLQEQLRALGYIR